jgi:FSR family fosmidomycin resistance protein-like MFS transporter
VIAEAPSTAWQPQATHQPDRRRLALLALAHAVTDSYGASFLAPVFPLLAAQLGLSMTMVGGLSMIMGLSGSLGQPLLGYLTDRYSRLYLVALGPAVAALGCGMVGHMPDYGWLLACLFITGLGIGAFHPQGAALAKQASGGGSLAMSAFTVGGNIGFGLAPLASALALRTLGLKQLHWIALPGLLLAAVVWWVFRRSGVQAFSPSGVQGAPGSAGVPDTAGEFSTGAASTDSPPLKSGEGLGVGAGQSTRLPLPPSASAFATGIGHARVAEAGPTPRTSGGVGTLDARAPNDERLNAASSRRPLAFLTASVAVRASVQVGMTIFLPFHLVALGVPGVGREAAKGIAVSVFLLANAFAGPLGGHLCDRLGRKRVMLWSFLLSAPPLVLAFQFPGWVPSLQGWVAGLAALALGGFILALPHPSNVIMAQELMPGSVGIAASLITGLAWGVALLLALPLGAVADRFGVAVVLHGLALLPLLGIPLVLPIPDSSSRELK